MMIYKILIGILLLCVDSCGSTAIRFNVGKYPTVTKAGKSLTMEKILGTVPSDAARKLKLGLNVPNAVICVFNGKMKADVIGTAADDWAKGHYFTACRKVFETTYYLMAIDVYQGLDSAYKLYDTVKDAYATSSRLVRSAITKSDYGKNLVEGVEEALRGGRAAFVKQGKKLLQKVGTGKLTKMGKFFSKMMVMADSAVDTLKWFAKWAKIGMVSDLLNIADNLRSMIIAYKNGPDWYDISACIAGILSSGISLAAKLFGPIGWVVSAILSAVNMLMNFLKEYIIKKDEIPTSDKKPTYVEPQLAKFYRTWKTLHYLGRVYYFQELVFKESNTLRYDYVFMNNFGYSTWESPMLELVPLVFRLAGITTNNECIIGLNDNDRECKSHQNVMATHPYQEKSDVTNTVVRAGSKLSYDSDLKCPRSRGDMVIYHNDKDYIRDRDRAIMQKFPYSFYGIKKDGRGLQNNLAIKLRTFGARHVTGFDIDTRVYNAENTQMRRHDDTIWLEDMPHFGKVRKDREEAMDTRGGCPSNIDDQLETTKVVLQLGYGSDVVSIAGRVATENAEFNSPDTPAMFIHFDNELVDSPDDTLQFKDMAELKESKKGDFEGLEIFSETEPGKIDVCYRYPNQTKRCRIRLTVLPKVLTSSPYQDNVYFHRGITMNVENTEGKNSYHVVLSKEIFKDLAESERKVVYIINDDVSDDEASGFEIELPQEMNYRYKSYFSPRRRMIKVYAAVRNDDENHVAGSATTLVRQISFPGKSTLPKKYQNLELEPNFIARYITEAEKKESGEAVAFQVHKDRNTVKKEGCSGSSNDVGYTFDTDAMFNCDDSSEEDSDRLSKKTNFLCFCKPGSDVRESYKTVLLGWGFNVVIIDPALLEVGNGDTTHTLKLSREAVYEDVVYDEHDNAYDSVRRAKERNHDLPDMQWVLQYRTYYKNQVQMGTSLRPHYDIVIDQAMLLKIDGSDDFVDLTDKNGLHDGTIDLMNLEKIHLFGGEDSFTSSAASDVILIDASDACLKALEKGGSFDLAGGADTVLISLESWKKHAEEVGKWELKFGFEVDLDDATKQNVYLQLREISNNRWPQSVEFLNVERAACGFKGRRRSFKKWLDETRTKGAWFTFEESECEHLTSVPEYFWWRGENPDKNKMILEGQIRSSEIDVDQFIGEDGKKCTTLCSNT